MIGLVVIFSFDPRRAAPSAPHFAQFWCNISPFRINTSKSVSKQTTLTPFRMNTYEKHGGGGGGIFRLRRNPTIDLPAPCRDFSASFPQHSNMQTFKHYNFRFSVHSSKFRIPQLLCLPLLRKHRGCTSTIPILELFPRHSPLITRHYFRGILPTLERALRSERLAVLPSLPCARLAGSLTKI